MKMRLTKSNYYSDKANLNYMSYSQFKDFLKCEAYGYAKANGLCETQKTDALLVGSYVDSWLDGELDEFRADNPEIFLKSGELKAQFRKAGELCEVIKADKFLYNFLKGKRQKIMTCNIAGVPFKVKIDSLHPDKIVDGKVLKDCADVWLDGEKKPFYMANRYDIQAAIYQTAVEQNTGKKLPFYLAVVTKETVPDKRIFKLKQSVIDDALQEVVNLAQHFQEVKLGYENAYNCGECDYCKSIKKLDENNIEEI